MPILTYCSLSNLNFKVPESKKDMHIVLCGLQQSRSLNKKAFSVQINNQPSYSTRNNNRIKMFDSELRKSLSEASCHIWRSWGSMKYARLCSYISWQWIIGVYCMCSIPAYSLIWRGSPNVSNMKTDWYTKIKQEFFLTKNSKL